MAQLVVTGQLTFFSETGTEGGYWAIQDNDWSHSASEELPEWCKGRSCPVHDGTSNVHWDYRGLHVIKDGDVLKIIDPWQGHLIWHGFVKLRQQDAYRGEYSAGGLAAHFEPMEYTDVDKNTVTPEEWLDFFLKGYPAVLETSS